MPGVKLKPATLVNTSNLEAPSAHRATPGDSSLTGQKTPPAFGPSSIRHLSPRYVLQSGAEANVAVSCSALEGTAFFTGGVTPVMVPVSTACHASG